MHTQRILAGRDNPKTAISKSGYAKVFGVYCLSTGNIINYGERNGGCLNLVWIFGMTHFLGLQKYEWWNDCGGRRDGSTTQQIGRKCGSGWRVSCKARAGRSYVENSSGI